MNQVHIDDARHIDPATYGPLLHDKKVDAAKIASGALNANIRSTLKSEATEEHKQKTAAKVSTAQAQIALEKLFKDVSSKMKVPSLQEVMQLDPMMLSMMMAKLVLNVSGNSAQSLIKQLERATEVQTTLRDKRVAEYQDQINKSVQQGEQVRKAGLTNALFDWIVSGIEVVMGALKIVEGALSANPLDIADGAAYLAAGLSGMVKAGAETAMALGADKKTCEEVASVAGKVQMGLEGVALVLDVVQIGRVTKGVGAALKKVMSSEVGRELTEAAINGAEKLAEKEINALAERVGDAVSRAFGENAGMAVEREMVEVGDMAVESIAHEMETAANVASKSSQLFTYDGLKTVVKTAVTDALKESGKKLVADTEQAMKKEFEKLVLGKVQKETAKTAFLASTSNLMKRAASVTKGVQGISKGIVEIKAAELRRLIERLIVQQGFISFIESWTEDRKEAQKKQLSEAYQNGTSALRSAAEVIDNYGSVLAKFAGARA